MAHSVSQAGHVMLDAISSGRILGNTFFSIGFFLAVVRPKSKDEVQDPLVHRCQSCISLWYHSEMPFVLYANILYCSAAKLLSGINFDDPTLSIGHMAVSCFTAIMFMNHHCPRLRSFTPP